MEPSIDGVKITDLKVISDERGSIRHMLKISDAHFDRFGEIYFSSVAPRVLKAWHFHSLMTLNYACIQGTVMVGLVDVRHDSPTFGVSHAYYLGADVGLYRLLTIPPQVWNGFMSMDDERGAIVANCANKPHDPREITRVHPDEFAVRLSFTWPEYDLAG